MDLIRNLKRAAARTVLVAALAGIMASGLSCNGDDGLGIKLKMEKRELSNGLVALIVEDHTFPLVSYQTWYKVGSVDERPGITGISHLFEHLMFKGTSKYGPKAFFERLESKGAEVNAYTTRDYTVYYENFTPNLLETVIDMEADRMVNLKLTEEVLRTERNVVFEERRLRTDNSPSGLMQEALWRLAYIEHPYQWPVIGYPEDLAAISLKDLQDYYKRHYHPGNATIVVVGDVDADRTFELIEKAYGGIPEREKTERSVTQEPSQEAERRYRLVDEVASQRFLQGYHITKAANEESYAIDVLANILFEGASSRAYRRLVDDEQLLLGVSGSSFTPTYPGLLMVSGTVKGKGATLKAERALDEIIRDVQENGVTDEEIAVAVKQLTVQIVDSVRTPYGLANLIGIVQTVLGDPYRFAKDLEKYRKVTREDVQKVARKYLHPNNRSVIVLVPPADAKGTVF